MRRFSAPAVVLFMLLAFTAGASAQAPNDPSSLRFDTDIVVTPERGETPRWTVPASTVVLEDAAALPAAHPSELVSFLPGFTIARSQLIAGRPVASARGFFGGGEAEYIVLLVDGVPVSDVESGLIDWSQLPASSIRRVEASRGPGASFYGDSAIGGIIQILTDRRARGGEATATAGSFGAFTGDGSYAHRAPTLGFNVSGAARRTGGGFDHSSGRQLVGSGGIDGSFRQMAWRWTASGDDRVHDDPGVLSRTQMSTSPRASDPFFRFDTLDRRGMATAFSLHSGSASWHPRLRVHAAARNEDLVRTILLAPGLPDRRGRALTSGEAKGSLDVERAFAAAGDAVVRFGADLSRARLDTSYRGASEDGVTGAVESRAAGHRLSAGFFGAGSWSPAPRVRLSGGIRWDAVRDSGFRPSSDPDVPEQRAWSPRAGVVYSLRDDGAASLFAQVSKAFKVPTLDQLFDPRPYPDFQGGTFTISNARLMPQRATNVEAGISGNGRRVRWSALAYRMTVDDEIDFDARTFSYANIGHSRHSGVELEAEGRWWERVRPSATYALTRVLGAEGRQLKNIPRHVTTAAVTLHLPWAIAAHTRYTRRWGGALDAEGAFPIEGPSMVDTRVRRPMGRHALFVDILNATGSVYEEYGFTLTDFGGEVVPYVYPGAPRAVRAGLTLSF